MDICDCTTVFMTKCDIPGRLRVKTPITHQVENPLSEKNIDPCITTLITTFTTTFCCDSLNENYSCIDFVLKPIHMCLYHTWLFHSRYYSSTQR